MKKKNKIEQELDWKEFENEIGRDLKSQYEQIDVLEKFYEGKNPYLLGFMNFFSSLLFFEAFYWLVKWNLNFFTLGFTLSFFQAINPFVHIAILIVSVHAVIKKRSAVEVVIDRWPF